MEHSSWNLFTFLGFFFTGLAVNLTPCVYPMLTVTVSLFKPKHAEQKTLRHSFAKAFAYFLGIALMYSTLGYIAASTGKIFGNLLQEGWVLAVVSLMMFALAFSMFGLYQFAIPAEVLSHLGRFRKVDFVGLFVSGLLVGIFAAPCIGPPVVALLAAVAQNGDPKFGFVAFLIFSFGLSLPYLILGTFSSLITKLPKAGSWLTFVEHGFGIILLGFGFSYLFTAIQFPLNVWVWPLTLTLGGIYLGFIKREPHEVKRFIRFKRWSALIMIVIGLSMASSILSVHRSSLVWKPFSQEALIAAEKEHKRVVIDFYADWCASCHELDAMVFSNPKVIPLLSDFVLLRVDATNSDDAKIQDLFAQYSIIGLPTVVFIDSKGKEVARARVEGSTSANRFIKSIALVQ